MGTPLLKVEDLTITYQTDSGDVVAVSNASFELETNSFFGLVGESGCGKSTLASSIMHGLDSNGRIQSGKIYYEGTEIHDYSESQMNDDIRWKEISWIPQSSMNSLDPLQTIAEQAVEIAKYHTDHSKEKTLEELARVFDVMGLPEERMTDYPHQFSGGMQQRAIIALALFLEPALIIADEPTTALDVLMQDQVLKYMEDIRDEYHTSLMLITHDIGVVFETCDHMAIMHGGQIAEIGSTTAIHQSPNHPYSILLQESFPDIRTPDQELQIIEGYPPKSYNEIDSCTFADRCPWSVNECRRGEPPMEPAKTDPDDHHVACIRTDEIEQSTEGSPIEHA